MDCCDAIGEPFVKSKEKQIMLRWILLGVSTLSFIFLTVTTFGCDFLKFEFNSIYGDATSSLGFFAGKVDEDAGCSAYASSDLATFRKDSAFTAGQTFACFAFISMTVTTLALAGMQLFFTLSHLLRTRLWLGIRIGFCVALAFNFFLFSAFGYQNCKDYQDASGFDCTPGSSAVMGILNVFLLIGIIVLVFLVPPPRKPYFVRRIDVKRSTDGKKESKEDAGSKKKLEASNSQAEEEPTHHADTENNRREYAQDVFEDSDDDPSVFTTLSPPNGEEMTTETTEIDNEGQVKTTKVTTHPDGSQTIVTTIHQIEDVVE